MRISPHLLLSSAAVALACVVSAAAYYYKSRNIEVNEVMVFCKLQYNPYNYFDKLAGYIEGAKFCVNVCMPGIHNPAIQARLVKLIKSKNIKVRIVIDRSGYTESTQFLMKELMEAGAEIRCIAHEPAYTMRHKFCLVDDSILMTGTLNWGNDRSYDHWNYVYITSKKQLVEPVKNQFYQMWNLATEVQYVFDIYSDSDTETLEICNPEVSEESDATNDDHNDVLEMDTPIEKQLTNNEFNSVLTEFSCCNALSSLK